MQTLPRGAIVAEHLWKRFRPDRRRKLLRDEMERVIATVRRRASRQWRWALRDVDFIASPGESIGLIGANGSGKSTLLKIMARVMYPYAGRINISGRVGALIEVRAGIHPDLTGRENVYLYGSLLGQRRKEVAKHFDEIVEFAELGGAIDRQVKFYSSGMQMRLGFSIAAFLEPDVLLVDEVLAVGDAAFQQRCLEQMRSILNDGTTLVFVSHDLSAVEATCSRGVWLDGGAVRTQGPVRDVIAAYKGSIEKIAAQTDHLSGVVGLRDVEVLGANGDMPRTQNPMVVKLSIDSPSRRSGIIYLGVSDGTASPIFVVRRDLELSAGRTRADCRVERLPLPGGQFYLWLAVFDGRRQDLLPWHPIASFMVAGPDLDPAPQAVVRLAPVHVQPEWTLHGS